MFQAKALRSYAESTSVFRKWIIAGGLAGGLVAIGATAHADDEATTTSHGYSYFGELDYPADFPHLDYVNPDAPKGGELSIAASGTFDSLNPYTVKGRAGALTTIQYDSLIEPVSDQVGQYYGVLAESLEYDAGRNWVIFNMRPEARFSDGTQVTAHDVVYSHKLFITQGLPSYAQAVSNMVPNAEALDDLTVKFTFNPEVTRRSLIETVGNTPVFSKAWFEADESRRLDEPRLEVAVGSGPYVLESYDINRRITYKRRDDYWGKDLPINVGRHNYDRIRIEYFSDAAAQFEGFKSGEFTFRIENDPKKWVTGYEFPKMQSGEVVKREIANGNPPTPSGFVFNLGNPHLADKRVREAMALAFNFEWTNESLLFNLRKQRSSFVEGTTLQANDVPEGAELAFLESLGDVVPATVFTEPVRTSHVSNPARLNDRRNLRAATKLFEQAGWVVGDDALLRNADGETLDIVMLYPSNMDASTASMIETYAKNLQSVGVNAKPEKVDPAQYTLRRREREFDFLYSTRYGSFQSTGGGLSQMYGSKEAAFSIFNPAGLASPFVDAVIEASFDTTNKADQDAALMALDRALRYEFFVVPVGYIPDYWVSYYDMYEHPENLPPFELGYLDLWWINEEKAAELKAQGAFR